MTGEKKLKYLKNICWVCGEPMLGLHYHETDEEDYADEPDDRDGMTQEFTESEEGDLARHDWAERYDELNGAPEGDNDR